MKRFNILFLIKILFIQVSLSQTTVKSYDGFSYSVGDTLQIGYPRYSSPNYDFILYPETVNGTNFYKKLAKENFPFTYVIIEKITPAEQNEMFSYTEKSPLLQVRSVNSADIVLFINLDYAIAQKEIVRNLPPQQPTETALKMHTLFAFYHKVYKKEITDDVLLQYIASKDAELGKECEQNRFAFQKIKAEWKATFEKEMASIDFNKVYYIEMPVTHSTYDFEKSGYWISYAPNFFDKDKNIIQFPPYFFLLQNHTKKNFLPLDANIAEKFEITQKGLSYYTWLGTLYARIFFKFSKTPIQYPKSDRGIALSVVYGDELMGVEIQKVDVFDHDSFQYNYLGTIR